MLQGKTGKTEIQCKKNHATKVTRKPKNKVTKIRNGPFNLQPLFQKGVEKWFEKSGLRNLVQEKWLTRKKGGFII